MNWETIQAPPGLSPPRPITVRAQSIPARHSFPEHAHRWNQMVYAISGVLTVAVEGHSFVISPEQAVWLPTGLGHRVGSLLGAEFRSLWIAHEAGRGLPENPTVFGVTPLLKALIVEATAIEGEDDRDGYAGRVTELILDQLRRALPPGRIAVAARGIVPDGFVRGALCRSGRRARAGGVGQGAWNVGTDPGPPLRGGDGHEPALLAAAPAAVQSD